MLEGATIARRIGFTLAGLAAAVAIGGCGGLDADKAEKNIKNGIEAQGGKGVKSVSCPSDIEKKEGETFQCTAVTGDGQQLAVKVTETDNDGGIAWQTSGVTGQQTAATTGPSGPSNPPPSGTTTNAQQPTAGNEPVALQFKTFRNRSGGYSVDYPGHWKRRGTAKDVSFAFGLRYLHLVSGKGGPQTPAIVRKTVTQDTRTLSHDAPKTVRIPAGRAVTINFTIKSGRSANRIRRYSVSGGGKAFLIDFGFAQNMKFDTRFNLIMSRVLRTFRIL